jgi:acyl-CoA synthetase (AMP-forming)/AMP-acid ligase II
MLPNGIEFFEVGLAAGRAGCRVVPINWHLKSEEAAWLLQDSGAVVLVTADDTVTSYPGITVLTVGTNGPGSYEAAIDAAYPAAGEPVPPIYVYYTSGTTGRPRGVERDGQVPDSRLVHSGLAAMWGITAEDVWLACSPLYHAANAYSYSTLTQGGTVVVQERWDAREWMRLVERHRVTACFMVPAHFIRLLEVPPEERSRPDLSSLRLILHSAAPCPVPVKWQILDALPSAEIWEFYGATEGGATRISPDEWRQHPGSVGTPWPGVEVRVQGDNGHSCQAGETGLIYIQPAGGARFHYLETIVYEKDGPVARIVLNMPEKANIQTAQQVWDFEDCLKVGRPDEEVKVLIVKANGNGFCAGHAIVEPDEMPEVYPTTGPTPERTWKKHNYDLFLWPPLRLWEFSKATIAQVHGYCVGGGTVYGYLCDLTVASDDAYFQMPLPQGFGLPGPRP